MTESAKTSKGNTEVDAMASVVMRKEKGSIYKCIVPNWLMNASSLLKIAGSPVDSCVLKPRLYLSASHEVFGLTLVICWAITLFYDKSQIFDHPARPIIGSLNPCFGWDYPPAQYIAIVLCSANVFFTWQNASFESARTRLLNRGDYHWPQAFATFASYLLAVASNCWLLLWSIGPDDGNWNWHTVIFLLYAVASYLACLSNYLETRFSINNSDVKTKHTVFVILYGCSAFAMVVIYTVDLAYHHPDKPPALPWYITQTADLVWVGCVINITFGTPPEPPLKLTLCIYDPDAYQNGTAARSKPSSAPPDPKYVYKMRGANDLVAAQRAY
eukprot:CAMPEP_0119325422 /NCGR_PEP_ID=MMETSP1333-20130426/65759_1 /TAXON_ID=418940 /ORGANISM="Scyphosphaera apsteinii, Strain RCC1455" /LENGTH=328 /DNA_ID=CAMNT_0007333403 /DNA_START=58 /DNA_END=1044 /DNA_ORIENTATION=+